PDAGKRPPPRGGYRASAAGVSVTGPARRRQPSVAPACPVGGPKNRIRYRPSRVSGPDAVTTAAGCQAAIAASMVERDGPLRPGSFIASQVIGRTLACWAQVKVLPVLHITARPCRSGTM